ncbi:uncharacterized protein LOC134279097 [Saccostrea cucullata]|uniref:uncharacterized protein LOC134279097 n=1 Tax=Saccostrea cuccullata TaxID=36930 RepID=UPI002ED5729C
MKMTEMKLLFIIFVAAKIGHIKTQCIASVPTIRYVPSCPSDEESWRKAELQKNCQSLAEIQTCVQDSSKFKYHCLVNTFLNATLEVCAPIRFLTGYCADFNIQESKVTENYNIDCTKLRPACPPRYESTEIYKLFICSLKENFVSFVSRSV